MTTHRLLVLALAATAARVAWAQTTIEVTSFADSGTGTLRDAITVGCTDNDTTHIVFAAGTGSPRVIQLQSPLPPIAEEPACAEPPCSLTLIATGHDVVLNGSGITVGRDQAWGLRITTAYVLVRGLVLQGFERGGILVDGANDGVEVADCYIGTTAAGDAVTTATVVHDFGIRVSNSSRVVSLTDNLVSGYTPDREALAAGIRVTGASQVTLRGNVIGLGAGGFEAVNGPGAQMDVGVWIGPDADAVRLEAAPALNVIASQGVAGLLIEGPNASGVWITGAHVGTDVTGTVAHGNGAAAPATGGGIVVRGEAVGVGVGMPGQGNVLAGNVGCQVRIDGTNGAVELSGNLLGGAPTDPLTPLVTPAGGAAPGNQNGVCIENGALATMVGHHDPAAANRIVFHRATGGACPPDCGAGVLIHGAATQGNIVGQNTIGFASSPELPPTGDAGNDWGLLLMDGTFGNQLGGGQGSWIGYNRRAGIAVIGAGTRQNPLVGNLTSANGAAAVPDVEICLAQALADCRVHGDTASAGRGNDGVAPPVFSRPAFFIGPGGGGMQPAALDGRAPGEGSVEVYRTPQITSNSGRGGTAELLAPAIVEPVGGTFTATVVLDSNTPACVTAIYTDLAGNSSELASNARVVFGPDDGLGAGSCGPRPDTTLPGGGSPVPACSKGFERDGDACVRALGCAGARRGPAAIVALLLLARAGRRGDPHPRRA